MTNGPFFLSPVAWRAAVLALVLSLCVDAALAQAPGRRGAGGPNVSATESLLEAGKPTDVAGSGFEPGQKIVLSTSGTQLNATPFVADAEGGFSGAVTIPASAKTGPLQVVVSAEGAPDINVQWKISERLPLSGQDRFDVVGNRLVRGLYQAAYSAASDAVYVTSAVGRPPVVESELLKVDPKTLEIVARTTPQAAPAPEPRPGQPPREGGVHAVYGVAVDDVNGTVWVTNTRQNTVAVYRQADLALVKQFPVGAVPHARDVVVDAGRGKAYVSANAASYVSVFDTRALEHRGNIEIRSNGADQPFKPASLQLDRDGGRLYAVGLGASEVAEIDTSTDTVEKILALENARSAIGVAYDSHGGHVLVVAQGSDNLLVVDPQTGRTMHDIYVGAGALNVTYDPVGRLAYVSNRVAGTVAVVDPVEGSIVANLDGGTFPNHVVADGKGAVFSVNKSRGEDDPQGDRITRIAPRAP